jgi:hypothetical protein
MGIPSRHGWRDIGRAKEREREREIKRKRQQHPPMNRLGVPGGDWWGRGCVVIHHV